MINFSLVMLDVLLYDCARHLYENRIGSTTFIDTTTKNGLSFFSCNSFVIFRNYIENERFKLNVFINDDSYAAVFHTSTSECGSIVRV